MDSQLAAVLTSSGTASMNRNHLPERTGKSMEMPPLTDIQDVPIDLSLKSSCSLPLDSQPLCLKMTPSCNSKAKQFYWTETRIQGRMTETSKDSTDTLEIVAEVTGVHKPVLSNMDSLPNSCKDPLTPGFSGCLLEQKGIMSESLSSDQSECPTASLVTVKEEIEEVCIGELEGYSDDQPDSPGSLNETNRDMTRDIADSTDTQSTTVSGANSSTIPTDTITALKTEPRHNAANRCGFTNQEIKSSEIKSSDLNGNDSSSKRAEMQVDKRPQLNLGILSDSGKPPVEGSAAEGGEKEVVRLKGRKECSSLRVVPAYGVRTRSQRRREMNREAKGESGKGENKPLGKDRQKREVLSQSSPPLSDLPGGPERLCEPEREQEHPDADRIGQGRECQRRLQEEVLDLSLSRKGGKSNTGCRKVGFEEGFETTLLMEVDEIVQQEVEEVEADAEILSREGEAAISFDLLNWEASFPSSPAPPSPSASPSVGSSLDDLLLIDDQGIPYMLTPDGQKVLQVELPEPRKAFTVRPRPKSKQVKPKDSTVNVALSNQVLPNALPCRPSGAMPSCLISPASPESSDESKAVAPSGAKSSSLAAPHPLTLSDLESQSQPIRILASSTTTSPILLLPSSQLSSLSPPKPNTNSGLMALSLPMALTQNSQSTPLLLVISPLAAGTVASTSSPVLTVNTPASSTLSLTQTTSPSAVSVPHYSVQNNLESSFPANPSLPALNPESCTLFTAISGNGNHSTPTSPSDSSSTEKPNSDISSKEIVPKLSPSVLLKSDPASDTKSSSINETQIERAQSPIPASLSPKEIPPYQLRRSLKASPSSASKLAPASRISANPFPIDDSACPTSGTPPPATIFPTNHPKNLNLSPNCPRRILYCQFCPRAFYYLSDLERHSITHSQSKPHVCPLCSKAFKRSSHLERHKHIHTGQRNFICPICAKRFREAGELLRHQRVHTGEKPFQCPQCHMRFAERNTLRRHAKRKHQDQPGADGQEGGCGGSGGPEAGQEDSAEWYSSTVPELDSDSDTDREQEV
ncbi:zinc finger E-box-binding homeobox 1 [Anguilla rostrata]|uniref:zinc finger E-box-binding homeobox 1 n=1 Tax=Anguilla rostrata TaxID=7938 RepID=UPI0030CE73FB